MSNVPKNSGIALLLTVIFVSALMSIVISLIAVFLPKLRTSFDVRNSVNALYAADTGIEFCLFVRKQNLFDNLAGHWAFDDGSGSSIAIDSSSNGFNGTLVNMDPLTDWVVGQLSGALDFDGNNDRVDIPNSVLNGLSDVTTTFWVKTIDLGQQAIISGANSSDANEFHILINSSPNITFFSSGAQRTWIPGSVSIADGFWHFVALVRDDGNDTATLYIDDIFSVTGAMALSNLNIEANGLVVGQDQDSVGGGFDPNQALNGTIDDLRIYNKVLTPAEINDIFTQFTPSMPTFNNGASFTLNPPDCSTDPITSAGSSGTFRGVNRAFEISF